MKSSIFSMFGSITVRLALVFSALAAMTAAAIIISWMVFQSIAANMQSLAEESIPDLQQNARMVSVADRVRGLLSDVLIADTLERLESLTFKKQLVIGDLRTSTEGFSGDKKTELMTLVANVDAAISDLVAARQQEFANYQSAAETVSEATAIASEVIAAFADNAAIAYDELVLDSQNTIAFVDTTLTELVEEDFDLFQTALAVRADMNLMMGAALTLTQTSDAAIAASLTALGQAASQRLWGMQVQFAEHAKTADLAKMVQEARDKVDQLFNGVRFGVSPADTLALRDEIDQRLSQALDDIYFDLVVNSSSAKTDNAEAINALIEDQVATMQLQNTLVKNVGALFQNILMAGLAQSPEELATRAASLQAAVARARSVAEASSPEIQARLADILRFADPETGIVPIRAVALAAKQAALTSTEAAAQSVRQIALSAGGFATVAQNQIAASAEVLTTQVARARMQIQSIGALSLTLVLIAPLLVWLTVSRPLNRVTKVTERLSQGDLSEIKGLDNQAGEIGRLAQALKVFRDGALERIEMQEAEKRRASELQEAERAAERAQHEAQLKEQKAEEERLREARERDEAEQAREEQRRQAVEAERRARAEEQELIVSELARSLKRLSEGDLTRSIDTAFPGNYESLRQDYNAAIANLAQLMRQIGKSADTIDAGSAEIAASSLDLSRRTENTAATLEETAAALSQLTVSVSSAARGAAEATETVDSVKKDAETSRKVMQEAVEAMGQIEESSREIAKIVEVIDSIAFQTNLLALNAGVEAARAGDAGRGFAVVASEVRILAHRCSDAAEQINKLISASTGHVGQGVSLIGQTSEALETILHGVGDTAKNVSEIALSAQEQSTGISEINAAVEQLDRSTQQNAAMFEETTAASQSLTSEAGQLTQLVAGFQIASTGTDPGETDDTRQFVA